MRNAYTQFKNLFDEAEKICGRYVDGIYMKPLQASTSPIDIETSIDGIYRPSFDIFNFKLSKRNRKLVMGCYTPVNKPYNVTSLDADFFKDDLLNQVFANLKKDIDNTNGFIKLSISYLKRECKYQYTDIILCVDEDVANSIKEWYEANFIVQNTMVSCVVKEEEFNEERFLNESPEDI